MSPATSPVLAVSGLSVCLPQRADRTHAVENASLSIDAGEIMCVVGESGSGKSVIAQAIMGLLPAALKSTAGSIRLLGEETIGLPPGRMCALRGSRMSMIFQEPMTALNPVAKVGRQISEVLRLHTEHSGAERRRRVIEIMRSVKLPDPETMYDAYPHELSGGQRQRVMIAAALVLEPSLLIADEPTTALDVTTQAQILALIKSIQRERGTAVMFITHDIGVVAEIADRVAVMCRGCLVEEGPTDQVLGQPRHPYTQSLIAAVPSMVPQKKPGRIGPGAVPVLRVCNLEKVYRPMNFFGASRTVHAVKDVSLDIRRGETVGIVGESGSGKSTLARCVVRLVQPSGGEIRLGGTDLAGAQGEGLRRERRRVQIVFQDPYRSLNPRRSVGQSIVECPLNYGVPQAKAWERARQLIQLVGLDSTALTRYPHAFSGGQRQRIAIARALAVEPELLVADEAVSALDVSVQAQILQLFEDICSRFDLALLFITHDLRVAAQICDRIAVMHRGEIVERGATADVFARPTHPYTQALFDAAPGQRRGASPITAAPG